MKPWRYLQVSFGEYGWWRRKVLFERWDSPIEPDGSFYPLWTLWLGPVKLAWLHYSPEGEG